MATRFTSALLLGVSLLGLTQCSRSPQEPTSDFTPAAPTPLPPGPDHLEKEDLKVGTGREAKPGDEVEVQYTGTLTNGKKFDSSYDHGDKPFKVTLGQGGVIKGWDEGIPGMRVGGKRRLRIPPDLAYGSAGSGTDIPANASLVFEIELVAVSDAPAGMPPEMPPGMGEQEMPPEEEEPQ